MFSSAVYFGVVESHLDEFMTIKCKQSTFNKIGEAQNMWSIPVFARKKSSNYQIFPN